MIFDFHLKGFNLAFLLLFICQSSNYSFLQVFLFFIKFVNFFLQSLYKQFFALIPIFNLFDSLLKFLVDLFWMIIFFQHYGVFLFYFFEIFHFRMQPLDFLHQWKMFARQMTEFIYLILQTAIHLFLYSKHFFIFLCLSLEKLFIFRWNINNFL